MFSAFAYIPDRYKTPEMCDNSVVSEYPFMLVHCPGRYKTQEMCDKAVDDCLAT